jgi:hypothetical protein
MGLRVLASYDRPTSRDIERAHALLNLYGRDSASIERALYDLSTHDNNVSIQTMRVLRWRLMSRLVPPGLLGGSADEAILSSCAPKEGARLPSEWPEPRAGDEDDNPLFDSNRSYVEQMDRYKKHQSKPTQRQAYGQSISLEQNQARWQRVKARKAK